MDLEAEAESLGVRPPPDPAALYREGRGRLDLVFPLPEELTSIPWDTLNERNRYYVLVAAWALREVEGIQHLDAGQLDEASKVFQECLVRAEYLETPELIARSYENLADMVEASGHQSAALHWRIQAAQIMVAEAQAAQRR